MSIPVIDIKRTDAIVAVALDESAGQGDLEQKILDMLADVRREERAGCAEDARLHGRKWPTEARLGSNLGDEIAEVILARRTHLTY